MPLSAATRRPGCSLLVHHPAAPPIARHPGRRPGPWTGRFREWYPIVFHP